MLRERAASQQAPSASFSSHKGLILFLDDKGMILYLCDRDMIWSWISVECLFLVSLELQHNTSFYHC
jgi:hypothetical protein